VVGKDLNWKLGAVEVVPPGFEGMDDCEEFSIIDVVISFCLGDRLREVGTGVPISIGVSLKEDSSRCMLGGVSGDGKRCGEVREMENWFQQEKGFESVERSLASRGPVPLEVFLGKVDEGTGDVGVVWDESTVEVGKAKEGAYVLNLSWGWPLGDAIEFDWVHGQLTGFDNHSEVFYLICGEFAFLKFEVQIEFSHALEDTFGAFLMSSRVGGEDKEVVHVDDEPSFCDHVSEGVVHEPLEGGGGVG